jgi:hypothetical protein
MKIHPRWQSRAIAIGVLILAFAVRLAWDLYVQSPIHAVFTDMGGYVDRAQWLVDHAPPDDPRALTFYPYGAHALFALEFFFLGRNSAVAIGVVHALVGAVPAACMVPLTLRFVPSRFAAALVGVVIAFWQPQVVYAGFFMSEIWFCAAIALHAMITVRGGKRGGPLLLVGILSAVAFVVRPQFLVTWFVDAARHVLGWLRRRRPREAARVFAWLAVPMVAALAVSSVRLYRLTGHFGLISDNANLNRLFGDTDVCRVDASWITPSGGQWGWWFGPPAKPGPCTPERTVSYQGYMGDAKILSAFRRDRLRGVSSIDRVENALHNVSLLAVGNPLFPESAYQGIRWRRVLSATFATATLFAVLPLCAIGLVLGRRDRLKIVTLANFAAGIVGSALYYGESRYRVPYDPFAILFAVVGVYEMGRYVAQLTGFLRRWARRVRGGARVANADAVTGAAGPPVDVPAGTDGATPPEPLRIARTRQAVRAEMDAFLATYEACAGAPPTCAALVRAWRALAALEALLDGMVAPGMVAPGVDTAAEDRPVDSPVPGDRVGLPRLLYAIPDDFLAAVLASARSEAWSASAPPPVPDDRSLSRHRRMLLRTAAVLEDRARRRSPGRRRLLRIGAVALVVVLVGGVALGFALRRPRWRASYYANRALAGSPILVERLREPDHDWGPGGPGVGLPTDDFSARFETCLVLDAPANIVFSLGSDDGSRLFVDDHPVIDAWADQEYAARERSIALDRGAHEVRLEYFERGGTAQLTFSGHVQTSLTDIDGMLRMPAAGAPSCGAYAR